MAILMELLVLGTGILAVPGFTTFISCSYDCKANNPMFHVNICFAELWEYFTAVGVFITQYNISRLGVQFLHP
jgi:hypothetical protein